MDTRPVSLGLRTAVALPQTVILPLALANATGVDRRLTIQKRDQTVPAAVRRWLKLDRRYAGWFDDAAEPEEAQADTGKVVSKKVAPTKPHTDQKPKLDGTSEGDETPPKDGEPETPPAPIVDGWSADWTVPQLRDYAKTHGIELTKDDLKADVIAKIQAARPDYEIKTAGESGEA